MILITSYGSLAMRANAPMQKNRKVSRAHQNVLIFYKGKIGEIKNEFGQLAGTYEAEQPESGQEDGNGQ